MKKIQQQIIKIEIGECLLNAIEIIDKSIRDIGGGAIGTEIKEAFGIDFSQIVDNKFIELKK